LIRVTLLYRYCGYYTITRAIIWCHPVYVLCIYIFSIHIISYISFLFSTYVSEPMPHKRIGTWEWKFNFRIKEFQIRVRDYQICVPTRDFGTNNNDAAFIFFSYSLQHFVGDWFIGVQTVAKNCELTLRVFSKLWIAFSYDIIISIFIHALGIKYQLYIEKLMWYNVFPKIDTIKYCCY